MMTKRWLKALIVSLTLMMLVGCGASTEETSDGVIINKDYSEKTMTTIAGEEVDVANTSFGLGATAYGYAMVYPESWKSVPEMNLYLARDEGVCVAGYLPYNVVETLTAMADSDMAQEKMAEASSLIGDALIPISALYAMPKDAPKPSLAEGYARDEVIGEANDYVYGIAYNTEIDTEGMSAMDEKNIDILLKSVEEMKNNLLIFPPQNKAEKAFPGSLENLDALDMNGNQVNADIFANYDLTMVNIWATWCGFCLEEMDELETVYQNLPSGVNVISICSDARENKELVQEILDKNGVTFQTIIGNDKLQKDFLSYVSGFPTTVFVDKHGRIVGDIQQGAPGKDVVSGYRLLIDEHLELVRNGGMKP